MAFPTGAVSPIDARLQSQFTLSGVTVVDGGRFDTANGWSVGGGNPWWDSFSLGNGPCVFFGGTGRVDSPQASWLSLASLALGIPFSVIIVFRADNNGALCELSANVSSGRGVLIQPSGAWTVRVNGPSNLSYNDHPGGQLWATDNSVHCLIVTCDGTTTALYVDGVLVKLTTDGLAPGTGSFSIASTIGAAHGGAQASISALGALYPYTRVLSGAEISAAFTEANSGWRLTSTIGNLIKYNVIATGASITAGAHTVSDSANTPNFPYAYPAVATRQIAGRFGQVRNLAVSGQTLAQQNTSWIANVGTLISGGGAVNIGILGGDAANNTLLANSGNVSATNTDMATAATRMCSDLSAASGGSTTQYQVIFLPEAGGLQAGIPSVNSNTRSNYTSWGAAHVTQILMDAGSDTPMGSAPGFASYFYVDNTHPAKPGHQRLGTYLANALIAAGL